MMNVVVIKAPDRIHSGYGVELLSDDIDLLDDFISICWEKILKVDKFKGFIQGKQKDWYYVECFGSDEYQSEFLDTCIEIGRRLYLPVDLK